MKLLMCTECGDIFNLKYKTKLCSCRKTEGRYVDELNATYSGPAIPIGFANTSFLEASRRQSLINEIEQDSSEEPRVWAGEEFTAFIIPEWAPSLEKI
jgi:hypothetical protein